MPHGINKANKQEIIKIYFPKVPDGKFAKAILCQKFVLYGIIDMQYFVHINPMFSCQVNKV